MFSFITINWRGRPLTNIYTVGNLISATTTQGGLTIQAAYDAHVYPKGVKIADTQSRSPNTTGTATETTP